MNTTSNKGFKTYEVKTLTDIVNGILDYFPFLSDNDKIKRTMAAAESIYSVVSNGRICLFTYDDSKPDYYYINHICTTIKFVKTN
jgi:hypothetical protein